MISGNWWGESGSRRLCTSLFRRQAEERERQKAKELFEAALSRDEGESAAISQDQLPKLLTSAEEVISDKENPADGAPSVTEEDGGGQEAQTKQPVEARSAEAEAAAATGERR